MPPTQRLHGFDPVQDGVVVLPVALEFDGVGRWGFSHHAGAVLSKQNLAHGVCVVKGPRSDEHHCWVMGDTRRRTQLHMGRIQFAVEKSHDQLGLIATGIQNFGDPIPVGSQSLRIGVPSCVKHYRQVVSRIIIEVVCQSIRVPMIKIVFTPNLRLLHGRLLQCMGVPRHPAEQSGDDSNRQDEHRGYLSSWKNHGGDFFLQS
mmetsp:Transcript_6518/g.13441  ORF Transcript_6518/g.13441 Transcript_6518/m.13441 type:complete len:203 (+) Transcript_6518:1646-2254(+)